MPHRRCWKHVKIAAGSGVDLRGGKIHPHPPEDMFVLPSRRDEGSGGLVLQADEWSHAQATHVMNHPPNQLFFCQV